MEGVSSGTEGQGEFRAGEVLGSGIRLGLSCFGQLKLLVFIFVIVDSFAVFRFVTMPDSVWSRLLPLLIAIFWLFTLYPILVVGMLSMKRGEDWNYYGCSKRVLERWLSFSGNYLFFMALQFGFLFFTGFLLGVGVILLALNIPPSNHPLVVYSFMQMLAILVLGCLSALVPSWYGIAHIAILDDDNLGAISGMKRSKKLVMGRWSRVFVVYGFHQLFQLSLGSLFVSGVGRVRNGAAHYELVLVGMVFLYVAMVFQRVWAYASVVCLHSSLESTEARQVDPPGEELP
mmetsp:Transcript_14578/g.59192  ORF Transcript_14578/g.59192 Transcript_14578/m.59192 type:complete len:288 (+) Transcript_14578:430-1293(+)